MRAIQCNEYELLRTMDDRKSLAGHILALVLNLVAMTGGICFLMMLVAEGSKSYEIWVCCIVIVAGTINSFRAWIAFSKIRAIRKK